MGRPLYTQAEMFIATAWPRRSARSGSPAGVLCTPWRLVAAIALLTLLAPLVGLAGEAAGQDGPAAPAPAVPAARQASAVAVITIEGEIDQWTVHSVKRRMEEAERGGAGAIVFDLNTPGGEVGAVLEICNLIKRSSIPNTVAWIDPDAYSGGAIIALACREIVVADYATMGDALPINILRIARGQGMPDEERQKVLAPLMAEVVDSARRRGYDEKLVQGFITLGVELWLVENVSTGGRLFVDEGEYRTLFGEDPPRHSPPRVASGAPTNAPADAGRAARSGGAPPGVAAAPGTEFKPASPRLGDDLVRDVSNELEVESTRPDISAADRGKYRLVEYVTDGRSPLVLKSEDLRRYGLATATVRNDKELREYFGAKEIVRMDPTWSEHMVRFMTSLPVRGVLIAVFLLALFIEMAAPGVGLPGTIALLALVGIIAPQFMVGAASWWGLASVLVGLLLVALEIFVLPGFGLPGIAGVVLLFLGLVGVVLGPTSGFSTAESRQELLWSIATVMMAFFTAGVGVYFVTKHYGRLPIFNRLILTSEPRDEGPGMLAAMAPAAPEAPVAIGDVGVATTPLRPAGAAEFGDKLVDVVCEYGFAERGARVRVTHVTRFRVAVERVDEAGAAPAPGARPDGAAGGAQA